MKLVAHAAVLASGSFWVFGGHNLSILTNQLAKYNYSVNAWLALSSELMPPPMKYHTVSFFVVQNSFHLDDLMYCIDVNVCRL